MKRFSFFSLFIVLLGLNAHVVSALELNALVTKNCTIHEGVILDVEDEKILMLDLEGQGRWVTRNDIQFLFVFTLIENPFARINISKDVEVLLRQFRIQQESRAEVGTDTQGDIIGWHLKTIENQIFILDIAGKMHVVDLFAIDRIRSPEVNQKAVSLRFKKPQLYYGSTLSHCGLGDKVSGDSIIPTRILSDQVQLSSYLQDLQEQFDALDSYQERTFLYARPILYELDYLMGLFAINPNPMTFGGIPGIYFQYGSARPFGLQSNTRVGTGVVEDSPSIDPVFGVRTEVKSHFFRASFGGNLFALPAGASYFTGDVIGLQLEKAESPQFRSWTSINYSVVMAVDYLQWSFGFGFHYPNYFLSVQNEKREILGTKPLPILKLRFIERVFDLFAAVSFGRLKSDSVSDNDISIGTEDSVVGVVNRFDFETNWLKAGANWKMTPEMVLSLQAVYLVGKYHEVRPGNQTGYFDFTHMNMSAQISRRFGNYVQLRGFYNIYHSENSYSIIQTGKGTLSYGQFGGAFEFIF